MYDICHPSYYYIGNLGCNDPVKISTTFYVYIELCERKRFWNVEYKYNEELDLLYLKARKTKNSPLETFVPWPTIHNVTIERIEKIQEKLQIRQFTFVFKAEDSTSVYYKVTAGLVKPLSPEQSKQSREKDEKKFELEKEIRKNTSNLYDIAKASKGNRSSDNNSDNNSDNSEISENLTSIGNTSEQDVIVEENSENS